MPSFGVSRGHIGLDIGTSAVRAAEIRGGRHPEVARFGQVLLPRGAVVDGEVQDPAEVAEALSTLWKRAGFGSRRVRLGVSNRRVVVRQLEMPAMTREDLDSAIRFQAQEYIPIPLAEAVMDFEVLEESTNAEGQSTQRVLVVAAERAMVAPMIEAVKRAKLDPEVLELNAYPLVRSLGGEGVLAAEVEAIVDVGGGVTNVVIHQGGKIRFTRILPSLGGDDFTNAVADALGLDWEDAEALKHRASARMAGDEPPSPEPETTAMPDTEPDEDLFGDDPFSDLTDAGADDDDEEPEDAGEASEEQPTEPAVAAGPPLSPTADDESVARAIEILTGVAQRFGAEIRGSVDFYTTQAGALELGRVVLTGGGSLLGGLVQQVGQALRVETERGRVFDRVPVGKVKLGAEQIAVAEPFLGVAVGLALGGLED